MTPGIQPSKVRMRLRKKLPIRPVISTAKGGSTTQKKYRSAFTSNASCSSSAFEEWALAVGSCAFFYQFWLLVSTLGSRIVGLRNLQSPGSTADRDKADAGATQDFRFARQYRSPCTYQSSRSAPLAFRGDASRPVRRCPADRALPPLASR